MKFFMSVFFLGMTILYIMGDGFAITEQSRFEYSLEINCLRNVFHRLHNSDNIYNNIYVCCKKFLCTFFRFLHNIM